ncbi:NAD(P)-binding domain-containing protein [Pelagibacterium halotolerans]|uniref:NAD(P)-binding domain-containing protein n=1 Tax=Pelagibacterium halotolerans TaxID=531813 RepID=UPI00384DE53B
MPVVPSSSTPSFPNSEIWIIGGYGDVGQKLARLLLATGSYRVVLAGRNAEKARTAAEQLGANARGAHVDAAEGLPGDAQVVVNFVETLPPAAAAAVVERGGVFIDASADPDYLERLKAAVPNGPGLAILNAGLTPGLTNVLARSLKTAHPDTRRIDVVLEMGMGRHHGLAATEWTLRGFAAPYRAKRNGVWRDIAPGSERRSACLDPTQKLVPAIGFAFSDQIAMAHTLDLDEARTFLALAPASMTRLLGTLAGTGPGRFIARRATPIAKLFAALPVMGPIRTRLLVEAFDARGQKRGSYVMRSGDQSDLTAAMLQVAVSAGLASEVTGAVDLDEVADLDACVSALEETMPETVWDRVA